MEDFYNIIISPETIKGDIFTVDMQGQNVGPSYTGETIGVYSAMTQILSGGTDGSSLLTGVTIPILQKFLELSNYIVNWGDGTPDQTITTYTPNSISHTYPVANAKYIITLKQTNPWGVTKVQKTITTPYSDVVINNPNGEAFFIPAGGNWFETPISYDYIFSGDAVNVVSAQTSNNFTTVPYTVSGLTKSKLNELSMYGPFKFQVGVPVIKNGQIWGAITNTATTFTAYTVNSVDYYDYIDGTTIFFEQSSGFTENNLTSRPITKEESLIKAVDQPQIQTDVFVERGKNSVYERIQRIGEVDNLGDMINYGYGFFNVEKKN